MKMEFTTNYYILLILILELSLVYDILVQIWSIMPDGIIGEKVIRMLRAKD
jgi:hypothetical protein